MEPTTSTKHETESSTQAMSTKNGEPDTTPGAVTQSFVTAPPHVAPHAPQREEEAAAKYHDISTAVMMATFLPGGGQLSNGQTGKALLLMGVTLGGLGFLIWLHSSVMLWIGLATGLVIYIGAILDAALIARRLRRQERVRPWQWF